MKSAIAFAAAVAVLSIPAGADVTTKHRHHRTVAQPVAQSSDPRIACTAMGCWPIPSGCGKRPGIPGSVTAARFDEVVCPFAVPGFRMR